MASHTPLSVAEVEELAGRWGLMVISSRPFGGGLNNTSYLLDTPDGQMVLTVVDFSDGLPVEVHAQLLSALNNAGLPGNEPLRALDGRFVSLHLGKAVMMKRYVAGKVPKYLDRDRLGELGGLLARVGRVKAPPGIRMSKRRLPADYSRTVERWPDKSHAEWVLYNAGRLAKLEATRLDIGLVHGDPFVDNTVLTENGDLCLIDWETASIDMLVFDIGFAIVGNCREGNELRDERVEVLLDGYAQHRPLRQVELDALPDAIVYAATVIGYWRYQHINVLHPEPGKMELYKEMPEFVATL